ncbi:MAG: FAD:protein FMN transferase [Actinomycetia bacterium]|nr:FAD:protein FMN transferase [Actinomycetes bacterium]
METITEAPEVVEEIRTTAMGSTLHLVATGTDRNVCRGVLDRAMVMIQGLEARWSRFRPTSEISCLNGAAPGTPVPVSDETILLVQRGIEAWRRTGGIFDPSMLPAVIGAGYDRPFKELISAAVPEPGPTEPIGRRHQPNLGGPTELAGSSDPDRHRLSGQIEVDPIAGTVTLPPGCEFDPGGLGKGLAADLVAGAGLSWGAAGMLVNLGGDLRCAGLPPQRGAWAVAVGLGSSSNSGEPMIALVDGGVATSTHLRRRWRTRSGSAHHLIDPATGRSAPSAATATVIAATACDAETLATTVAVCGGLPDERAMLGDAVVLVVDQCGNYSTHGEIERYLR